MNREEFIKALKNYRNGRFIRMNYVSELPMTAAAKKLGFKAFKYTSKLVRFGVEYSHIGAVKVKEAIRAESGIPKRATKPWYHYEIPHLLAKHDSKDSWYAAATYIPGAKGSSRYTLRDAEGNEREITATELKDGGYVINSYFTGDKPEMQLINVENIISIGGAK